MTFCITFRWWQGNCSCFYRIWKLLLLFFYTTECDNTRIYWLSHIWKQNSFVECECSDVFFGLRFFGSHLNRNSYVLWKWMKRIDCFKFARKTWNTRHSSNNLHQWFNVNENECKTNKNWLSRICKKKARQKTQRFKLADTLLSGTVRTYI